MKGDEHPNDPAALGAEIVRLRQLVETLPVAVARSDRQGRVLFANRRMGDLVGRDPDSFVGTSWLEFLHPEDRRRVTEEWLEARASEGGHAGTFRILRPDGSSVWVMSRSVSEGNADSDGFVSTITDISERKRIEDELNRRVADRTMQLVQANNELEAFCYSVSHDLRAPLRSIDGFCHLVAEEMSGLLTAAAGESLGRVRAASRRMSELIDDLLRLSRASLGELTREAVDLSALAERIAGDLRRSDPARAVSFSIQAGLVVRGDPTLLEAMLENLLGNAFKFTSKVPRPAIVFAAEHRQGERVYVVRDNGAGFDMSVAEKLFVAFHRLHDDDEFEGTGVGLATVDRVVRRHGGRVWAEARPGQGASFYFTLP